MHGDARGKFSQWYIRITEPIIFGNRPRTLIVLFLATLFLGYQASQLRPDAGFEKQLPLGHPYIQVFKQYQKDFGGANTVLVALEKKDGDIYQPAFMETLRQITDEVFFIPGVDRARVKELAAQQGMRTLREDAWAKVQAGITTVEEVLRVVQ